jgi:Ca2+-binding RTX toxin-like protein
LDDVVRVNDVTPILQLQPAGAPLAGGGFVIAWVSQSQNPIYLNIFDADGEPRGPQFQIDTVFGEMPALAGLPGGGFVLTWQSGEDIFAQRFDASGHQVGDAIGVASTPAEEFNAEVAALSGGGFVVSWDSRSGTEGAWKSYARLYDTAGAALGPAFTLGTTAFEQVYFSSVAPLQDGGFVGVWTARLTPNVASITEIWGQRFSAGGEAVGDPFRVSAGDTHFRFGSDVAALADGSLVAAWTSDNEILARHFDAAGHTIGGEIAIGAGGGLPSVTRAGNGFLVSWEGQGPNGATALARAYDGTDAPLDSAFAIDSPPAGSASLTGGATMVLADGTIVVTWEGDGPGAGSDILVQHLALGAGPSALDDTIAGTSGNDVIQGWGGNDILSGLAGNDLLIGGTGNDTLDGGDGRDSLVGGPGDDRLSGGSDVANELAGGTGDDLYIVTNSGDTIIETDTGGADRVETALTAYVLPANVEELSFTGTTAAILVGNSLANRIEGGPGSDELQGGAGDDTYLATPGDTIVESVNGGNDTVETMASVYVLPASNVENLVYLGTAAASLTGNALDNHITGGDSADELAGGLGNDTYYVGLGGDTIIEAPDAGIDTIVTANGSYAITAANVENLVFVGTGDFAGRGNALSNQITSGAGSDLLDGREGDDVLIGGTGADYFLFDTALVPHNVDTLSDFLSGQDRILLDHGVFNALGMGVLDPAAFVVGTAAQSPEDRIVYDPASGAVWYDADGNGSGAAVQFASLPAQAALVAGDFAVI